MPRVVDIALVTSRSTLRPLSLKKVKATLQRQGLIEPLVVYPGTLEVGREPWDHERLIAARELGWQTVLVTDGRY